MSLATLGIIVCVLLVAVCIAICMAHHDGQNQWRVGNPSKDTQRGPDCGWWT